MYLEILPNETILDLFEYISISDLFHGFFNLNARFNRLLCVKFQKFHLDLRLLSKTKCNQLCQNIIPLIIDRIISLHLSDDHNTPQQINFFLSQNYQLRQFIRLQSISLSYVQSPQMLEQILIECSYLPSLTHLTFTDSYVPMDADEQNHFHHHIWSLTNLTYCYFGIWFSYPTDTIPKLTVTSTSITHLIFQSVTCSTLKLAHLCQQTPNLEQFSIIFNDESNQLEFISPILSLTRLKILVFHSIDINVLKHLLQHIPNLYQLTMEMYDGFINGYQWEEIIRNYLPKLKIFQFRMTFLPSPDKDKEVQLNEIVDTYRTKFWIDEHQWFIRCLWWILDRRDKSDGIELFSLPYAFREYSQNGICILSNSTCPSDDVYLTCDRIRNLSCTESTFTNSIGSNVCFSNIQYLSLTLPFDNRFLTVLSNLNRVTSLSLYEIKGNNLETIRTQLQVLLDQTLHLHKLSFFSWSVESYEVVLMKISIVSVRRLDLELFFDVEKRGWLDNEQCIQLYRSSLGKQCETLSVQVKHWKSIIDLVNNMPHLQALKVECQKNIESTIDDKLVEDLRQQLPSTCTIVRDPYFNQCIRLWIR